jgi:hypothetical protein
MRVSFRISDLKRDASRGRRNGQETWRKYSDQLKRDTVILLYDVKLHENRIDALNNKVRDAWDQFRPTWREELAAKKGAKKAAMDRAKTTQQKSTRKKSGAT